MEHVSFLPLTLLAEYEDEEELARLIQPVQEALGETYAICSGRTLTVDSSGAEGIGAGASAAQQRPFSAMDMLRDIDDDVIGTGEENQTLPNAESLEQQLATIESQDERTSSSASLLAPTSPAALAARGGFSDHTSDSDGVENKWLSLPQPSLATARVAVRAPEVLSRNEVLRQQYRSKLPDIFKSPFQVVENDITARMSTILERALPHTALLNSCELAPIRKVQPYDQAELPFLARAQKDALEDDEDEELLVPGGRSGSEHTPGAAGARSGNGALRTVSSVGFARGVSAGENAVGGGPRGGGGPPPRTPTAFSTEGRFVGTRTGWFIRIGPVSDQCQTSVMLDAHVHADATV